MTKATQVIVNCAVDDLNNKIESTAVATMEKTEIMCEDAYKSALRDVKLNIKNTYLELNWFQRLLWRLLGLHKLGGL